MRQKRGNMFGFKFNNSADLDDEDIYVQECLQASFDDDSINAAEEGFMVGYLQA